jgi:hypothetical protein
MPPELLIGARSAAAAAAHHHQTDPGLGGGGGGGGGGGAPPYDAAAVDAWACGVLLYLLVSGVGTAGRLWFDRDLTGV